MRFFFLSSVCLLACVGDVASTQPIPDASTDQNVMADVQGDAADAAPFDPTWTLPLQKGTSLTSIAVDTNGDVYVAGVVSEAFTLDAASVASTQGNDGFLMKLDGKTKKAVWAKGIGGAGSDSIQGLQFDSGALYILGITDGASVAFAKNTLNIPTSSGGASTRSFFAKIDPTDGSDVYAVSPDQSRSPNTAFSSLCTSLAVVAKKIVIACTYSGASFASLPTPPNAQVGIGILGYDDGFQANLSLTKAIYSPNGAAFPNVAIDGNGDPWVAGAFRGPASAINLIDQSVLMTGSGQSNLFVMHLTPGTIDTKVVKSQVWAAGAATGLGALPSNIRGVAVSGNQVFVAGSFYASAAFDTPVTSSGAFDGFAMALDTTTLKATWQTSLGGALSEIIPSITPNANGAYVALIWGSNGLSFGKTALSDPPNPYLLGGIGSVDTKGAPVSALVAKSVNSSSYIKVVAAGSYLYGVGQYQGATTFDDGTVATGSLSSNNGFVVRRAKF
jgi:hypothetical protein